MATHIGPFARPGMIVGTPGLPKTRSGEKRGRPFCRVECDGGRTAALCFVRWPCGKVALSCTGLLFVGAHWLSSKGFAVHAARVCKRGEVIWWQSVKPEYARLGIIRSTKLIYLKKRRLLSSFCGLNKKIIALAFVRVQHGFAVCCGPRSLRLPLPSLCLRPGKIMRRILRKIAEGEADKLGDTSTLADPSIVDVSASSLRTGLRV